MPNSRSRSAVLCAAVAALFSGCQEQANPTQPQTARSSAVVARYLGPVRPGEASFAQLAEKAPSSAGFYFNQAHDLVVVVRDPSDASAATTALQSMVAARQISLRHGIAPNVVVQHGKYTFAELATWRDALSDALLGQVSGVTSVDLNEQSNRVVVGLDPAVANAARQSVSGILQKLTIDSGGVAYRNERFIATNGDSITSEDDSLAGGIFISNSSVECTLGFIADIGTQRAFVTASHCTPTVFHLDLGSPMYQKFPSDNLVGTEYLDPAGTGCLLPCRRADAAAFKVTTFPTEKGLIVRTLSRGSTGNGSFAVDPNHPYFIINAAAQSITGGEEINKMGIGAGWTWGDVTNTCVDLQVSDTITNVSYVVKCAYEGGYRSRPGDSGGPIFAWNGGDAVTLAGVNFGESSDGTLGLFSAYADISAILGAMTVTRGTNLATPLLSGQVSEGLPALSWGAVSGATRYDIFRDSFDNQHGTSTGMVYIGSTDVTSYRDEIPVTKYDGTTNPGPRVPGYLEYQIYAASNTDLSASSRAIYFTTP